VPSLDASIGTFVHSVAEALCRLPSHRRTIDEARAAAELLHFRASLQGSRHPDVLRVVLARGRAADTTVVSRLGRVR